NYRQDVFFAHEQQLFGVRLEFVAGIRGEEDFIALLDLERLEATVLEAAPGAHGDDFTALGLLLSGIRQDDSARRLLFGADPLNHHTVSQRLKLHFFSPTTNLLIGRGSSPVRYRPAHCLVEPLKQRTFQASESNCNSLPSHRLRSGTGHT